MEGNGAADAAHEVHDLRARAARHLTAADDMLTKARETQKRAKQMHELSDRLVAFVEENEISEADRFLSANAKTIAALGSAQPEFATAIAAIRDSLQAPIRERLAELERVFGPAARAAGLEPDSGSRHPKYTFFRSFLVVQFDKEKCETRISPRDGRRLTVGVDLPVVIRKLVEEQERLFGRPFDEAAFAQKLRDTCARLLKGGGVEPLPLKDVAAAYCADHHSSPDEFNIDLAKLLRSGGGHSAGFRLDHTREAKQGLLLWGLDDRGYYGYITNGEGIAPHGEQIEPGAG